MKRVSAPARGDRTSKPAIVHGLSRRRRWGRPLTVCGVTIDLDLGWGRSSRPLDCRNCIAVLDNHAKGPAA